MTISQRSKWFKLKQNKLKTFNLLYLTNFKGLCDILILILAYIVRFSLPYIISKRYKEWGGLLMYGDKKETFFDEHSDKMVLNDECKESTKFDSNENESSAYEPCGN